MSFPRQLTCHRNRLLWRIHRSYATQTQEVQIRSVKFSFTRIADPDSVLDRVAEEADRRERLTGRRESDEQFHLPYWAELWDSALGLSQFMVHHGLRVGEKTGPDPLFSPPANGGKTGSGAPFRPVRVLDLGCGMGLSGTIAAALGAEVMFADIETPALLFARLNSLPWKSRITTRRLNWRTDQLDRTFDLILGADILYERAQWEFLEPFWRSHLTPGGAVLLGEPGRQTGDLFIDWIRQHPWRMQLFEEPVPQRAKPIRIFLLKRVDQSDQVRPEFRDASS
jgi:predicted nicotinamide N-methyase